MKIRIIALLLMLVLTPAFAAESLDAEKLATSIDMTVTIWEHNTGTKTWGCMNLWFR